MIIIKILLTRHRIKRSTHTVRRDVQLPPSFLDALPADITSHVNYHYTGTCIVFTFPIILICDAHNITYMYIPRVAIGPITPQYQTTDVDSTSLTLGARASVTVVALCTCVCVCVCVRACVCVCASVYYHISCYIYTLIVYNYVENKAPMTFSHCVDNFR